MAVTGVVCFGCVLFLPATPYLRRNAGNTVGTIMCRFTVWTVAFVVIWSSHCLNRACMFFRMARSLRRTNKIEKERNVGRYALEGSSLLVHLSCVWFVCAPSLSSSGTFVPWMSFFASWPNLSRKVKHVSWYTQPIHTPYFPCFSCVDTLYDALQSLF